MNTVEKVTETNETSTRELIALLSTLSKDEIAQVQEYVTSLKVEHSQ